MWIFRAAPRRGAPLAPRRAASARAERINRGAALVAGTSHHAHAQVAVGGYVATLGAGAPSAPRAGCGAAAERPQQCTAVVYVCVAAASCGAHADHGHVGRLAPERRGNGAACLAAAAAGRGTRRCVFAVARGVSARPDRAPPGRCRRRLAAPVCAGRVSGGARCVSAAAARGRGAARRIPLWSARIPRACASRVAARASLAGVDAARGGCRHWHRARGRRLPVVALFPAHSHRCVPDAGRAAVAAALGRPRDEVRIYISVAY